MQLKKELQDLFDELETGAYNPTYHYYYYKETNQIIRKHVEALLIQRVVRPNLTDKHPIKGVNETMQVETKISKSQVVCDGCGDVGVRYLTNVGNYCFFCDPT